MLEDGGTETGPPCGMVGVGTEPGGTGDGPTEDDGGMGLTYTFISMCYINEQ